MGNSCTSTQKVISTDMTPDPVTGLSPRECDLIQETWTHIVDKKVIKQNGVELFVILFRTYPELQGYFKLFHTHTEAELRASPQLRAHAVTVLKIFSLCVENITDLETLIALIEKISKRHVILEIHKDAFEKFCDFVPNYVELLNGKSYTKEVDQAWRKFMNMYNQKLAIIMENTTTRLQSDVDELI